MFAQANGRPIDPRADYAEWKALLEAAGVREARLHDARHTAATMLLVLNVPSRMVMDLMGWSQLSMTQRYQHVPFPLRRDVADELGHLLWSTERRRRRQRKRSPQADREMSELGPRGLRREVNTRLITCAPKAARTHGAHVRIYALR